MMKPSENCYELIKEFEGFHNEAYLCPAGVWTIGYGTTFLKGKRVVKGDSCTLEEAQEELEIHIEKRIVRPLNTLKLITSNLDQSQFDAVVDFIYNLGIGAFQRSNLRRVINKNPNDPLIASEFMKWVRSGGKVLRGLVRRRNAESWLYFKKQIKYDFS